MFTNHGLALDKHVFPDWLQAVALRVDELVGQVRALDHFQQMLRAWKIEHDARGPSTPIDRHGAIRYSRDTELLPARRLTLPEKYLLVAAIHDVVCTTAKSISPWGSLKRREKNIKKLKSAMSFVTRCDQVKNIGDKDRVRIEQALQEVEGDVAHAVERIEGTGFIAFGNREFHAESLAAAILHLSFADDTGPATRTAPAFNRAEKRWLALRLSIRKFNALGAPETREFEDHLHGLMSERLELLKPWPIDLASQAKLMKEESAWKAEIRKMALFADEIEKRCEGHQKEGALPEKVPKGKGKKVKRRRKREWKPTKRQQQILAEVKDCGGDQSEAATILGVSKQYVSAVVKKRDKALAATGRASGQSVRADQSNSGLDLSNEAGDADTGYGRKLRVKQL